MGEAGRSVTKGTPGGLRWARGTLSEAAEAGGGQARGALAVGTREARPRLLTTVRFPHGSCGQADPARLGRSGFSNGSPGSVHSKLAPSVPP